MPSRRSALVLAAAVILGLAGAGCATASRQSIRAAHADALERLAPGTTVEDFKRLLPRARLYDTQFTGGRRTDIYRLDHRYKPDELPAETQTLYFFFSDGRLLRWGQAPW